MATSDLDLLIEMGFDKERAELAVKHSGGLQPAIEWLEVHQDKSLDEVKASLTTPSASTPTVPLPADAHAKSLICNICKKQFRTHAAATVHAEKTDHTDFSESTDEIAPLTEEQKAQQLHDLRQHLAEKRATAEIEEKEKRKRNEQIRLKNTKETQDAKEQLKVKEQLRHAEQVKKEKAADKAAKAAILAKIAADKEERRLRAQRGKADSPSEQSPTQAAAPPSAPVTSKPASAYTETRLRLQTPAKGNVMMTLPVDTTLFEVALKLEDEHGCAEVREFLQTFPKKTWQRGEERTLRELGMVPSASLVVTSW